MIFAVATDERTLFAFPDEATAVAHCEGLDVESADWLFWDDRGSPLEPVFTKPNRRGLFVVENGTYILKPASPDHHADLIEALGVIQAFDARPPFDSAQGVERYLRDSSAAHP